MPDPTRFRLRAVFCKQGRLALLSHLEVARALERAVRRAGLPFAVSEGFSPHMKIAFGAALPVGVGGTREIFDLQLTRYVAPDKALAALQATSAADLMVRECFYIEPGAPAASVAYPVSTYRALLSRSLGGEGGEPVACLPGDERAPLSVPEVVTVVRKKKEKELRVADYLVGGAGADGAVEVAGAVVGFSLAAKQSGSLRPDKLMAACLQAANARCGDGEEPIALVGMTRIDQRERA